MAGLLLFIIIDQGYLRLEHFVFNLIQIKSFHFLQIMIRYIYIIYKFRGLL